MERQEEMKREQERMEEEQEDQERGAKQLVNHGGTPEDETLDELFMPVTPE